MAVPKISSPHIPLTLPFTKKEVVIRHLLLREYKAFLSSANSQHLGTLTKTVLDVIKSCVIEPENFSLKSIPSFEAEYLFLNIYGASVPDGLSVSYRCVRPVMKPEFIEDEYGHVHPTGEEIEQECGFKTDLNISLKDVELTTIPEQVVQLNNEIVLKLKFPSMEDYYALAEDLSVEINEDEQAEISDEQVEQQDVTNKLSALLFKCVDSIWVNDEKWEEAVTQEEFAQWISSMPITVVQRLMQFPQEIPQLKYSKDFICEGCGHKHHVDIIGLQSFLK